MIKKYFLLLLICVFIINNLKAQVITKHRIIRFFKRYDLDSIKYLIANNRLKNQVFNYENTYLKNGINKEIDSFFKQGDYINNVLYHNYLGDYFLRQKKAVGNDKNNTNEIYKLDSLSFVNYLKALSIGKAHKDTLLINESLRRIINHYNKNTIDIINFKKYINELTKFQKDSIDLFWLKYYNAMFLLSKYKHPYNTTEKNEIEQAFNNLHLSTPNIEYHKGVTFHSLGMCYTLIDKKEQAEVFYNKALATYNKKYYYSYSRKINTLIARSMINYNTVSTKEIDSLKKYLKDKFVIKNKKLEFLIFDRLHKLYKTINKDSSNHYLKLLNLRKKEIKLFEVSIVKNELDIINRKKEIKKELSNQKTINKTLKTEMNTILPILAIISFFLVVMFILYKKYYKKSEVLETEQSQTLQKLDELKKIVIKNHIVLKDKTKIYITDLLYIKSDDHYLNIFLSDGKNHFVRGKLNIITKELPPNFIRCHRSYIVNANFIKQVNSDTIILIDKTQIPLSRSYKDKF